MNAWVRRTTIRRREKNIPLRGRNHQLVKPNGIAPAGRSMCPHKRSISHARGESICAAVCCDGTPFVVAGQNGEIRAASGVWDWLDKRASDAEIRWDSDGEEDRHALAES